MRSETQKCRDHDHPEFVLEVDGDQIPDVYVQSFLETLETMVASGSVFKPGETLQDGWMVTRVEQAANDKLTLHEPDMQELPVAFVPGVTETLRHKMIQLFTLDSYGIDRSQIAIPRIDQTAITCDRFDQGGELLLARDAGEDRYSGWLLCCLDEDHDHEQDENLKLVSLYEAMLRCPYIVAWMYFPLDSQIVLRPDKQPLVILQDEQVDIQPGSYLDELWKKQAEG